MNLTPPVDRTASTNACSDGELPFIRTSRMVRGWRASTNACSDGELPQEPSTENSISRDLFQLLVDPTQALSTQCAVQSVGLMALVLFLAQVSRSLGMALASTGVPAVSTILLDILFTLFLDVAMILVMAAFTSLYLSMMGGRTDGTRLLWVLGLGEAPWVFATPLVLIARIFHPASPPAYSAAMFLIFVGLAIYSIVIKVEGMARTASIPAGAAAFCFLAAIGTVTLILLGSGLGGWLWAFNRMALLS